MNFYTFICLKMFAAIQRIATLLTLTQLLGGLLQAASTTTVHITLFASNIPRSIAFYESFDFIYLPSPSIEKMGFDGAWLQFPVQSTHGVTTELHLLPKRVYKQDALNQSLGVLGSEHFGMLVDGTIHKYIAKCRDLGYSFTLSGMRPTNRAYQVFIDDPDGNKFEILDYAVDVEPFDSLLSRVMAQKPVHDRTSETTKRKGKRKYQSPDTSFPIVSKIDVGSTPCAKGRGGAVSFENPIASDIAMDILRKGGSAADAAIAGNAAMAVLEPMNCGVGGDMFALVYENGVIDELNASGGLASGVTAAEILRRRGDIGYTGRDARRFPIPMAGPTSAITVPGVVAGWCALHEKHGRLSWEQLLQPAISLAFAGFALTDFVHHEWEKVFYILSLQSQSTPALLRDFLSVYAPNGFVPATGEKLRSPGLGRTLSILAKGGCPAFYTGLIADEVDAYAKKHNLLVLKSDLEAFWKKGGAQWTKPGSTTFEDTVVYGVTQNSQGFAALTMLNALSAFSVEERTVDPVKDIFIHLSVKRAVYFYERAVLGGDVPHREPSKLNVTFLKEHILDCWDRRVPFDMERAGAAWGTALKQRQRRQLRRSDPRREGDDHPEFNMDGDTMGFVVTDSSGLTISVLQSLHSYFGSGIVNPDLGFIMQNRGIKFALEPPEHPNYLLPGKRPFHTLSPWLVADKAGKLQYAIVVKGGDRQVYTFTQVLINLLDRKIDYNQVTCCRR